MELGETIRQYRQARKLTQERLAELSNMSINFLSQIERGEITNVGIEKLANIAQALDINLADLFEPERDKLNQTTPLPQIQTLVQQLQNLDSQTADRLAGYFSDIVSLYARKNKKNH